MQRYRVNYRLLVTLVTSLVVAAPAAYGLWRFQVDRNASRMLVQADAAEEKSDYASAFDSLSQYVKLRKSDPAAQIRLGKAAVELSKQPDIDSKLVSESYYALVGAVQFLDTLLNDPETSEDVKNEIRPDTFKLRRELVNLHMRYQLWDRALQAIDELIADNQADSELRALKAQALFATQKPETLEWAYRMIGYDKKSDEFDLAKAEAPDQPRIYAMLAQYLLNNNDRELAGRVADQLVVANPESRDAYVFQFQILSTLDRADDARAAIEKAYAIDPKDEAVLRCKGLVAIDDYQRVLEAIQAAQKAENSDDPANVADIEKLGKDAEERLDEAAAFFVEGQRTYPDNISFYVQVARIEYFRQHMDECLKIVAEGLKKFDLQKFVDRSGMPFAIDLENQKIDVLFFKHDFDGVRKEIKILRGMQNLRIQALADYYEARIEMANQNWVEAAQRLKDVKVRLVGDAVLQAMASASQAVCHYQLGQFDLARTAYRWALEKNPKLALAIYGLQEVKIGLVDDENTPLQFDDIIAKELEKPVAEQNWTRVEEMIDAYIREQAEKQSATRTVSQSWIKSRGDLLRAQMYVSRAINSTDKKLQEELFAKAREAVTSAYNADKDDVNVQLAVPRVLMLEPSSGPAQALKALDGIIARNKKNNKPETLPYRLLRIDLLVALHDEQLPHQLHATTEGISDWRTEDQAQVWFAVSTRFEQLGQLADAELCLKEAAKLAPTLLPFRVALFELARKQANDDDMREAQKGIVEILKDRNEPDYVLTEVKRLMVAAATGAITRDELKGARRLLDDAIKRRPTWGELYILSGQLYMLFENDPTRALASFDQAMQLGRANLNAVNLHIRLLAELGRFAEARKMMENIPEKAWGQILDRTAAFVLLNAGEHAKAFIEAKKVADANPTDAAMQLWFAEVAAQCDSAFNDAREAAGSAKPAEFAEKQKTLSDIAARSVELAAAEAAYKKAIELNPGMPDYWSLLLGFYMSLRRSAAVESTLRQAQLSLDDEYLTLLTAQQHRLFGRFAQAESIFLSSYGEKINDPQVAQRMAEFYLGWGEHDPPYLGKAARHLNTLLRAANEGKLPQNSPYVLWARRQAARVLSLSGDYRDSLKAEQLLATSMDNNVASQETAELLVDTLNRRGDPASRKRLVTLLRKLQSSRTLQPKYELLLGQALADVAEWSEAERQMQEAISRYPNDISLRVGLIEMLIARKDASGAERWISRLSGVKDGAPAIPQLKVRLAAAKGDKEELRKYLVAITPPLNVLKEKELAIVHSIALLADSVGDHEYALQLITEYSHRVKVNDFELAQYTAMYGNVEAGLNALLVLFPTQMDDVLNTSIEVLRNRRAEDPEKIDGIVNSMIRRARSNDPESARRMVQEAEAWEIEEKYPEAIAKYNTMLDRDDVPRITRATAYNNRAFLLAITKQDLDRDLKDANAAMEILGPISDVLDTRGLVYLHRGEFSSAIEDLKLAVTVNATASKYFHLTEAYLGAGDTAAAVVAWKQAQSRGISLEKTPTVERPDMEQTMKKLEALGAPVASN